jgi:trigger factor
VAVTSMQISETKSEGLQRDFKIIIPADDIEAEVAGRLKELATTVQLPGFRPGKIPVALLRKKYGASVMGEVIEHTVSHKSHEALTERGLRPAMQPRIEITSFEDGADLEFTMAVELMPEFEPVDFATIELENMVAEPSDDEVQSALERIAENQRVPVTVEEVRPSKEGDYLVIDFVGRVDEEEFPGGQAEGYVLELGSGSFIPGFEGQLVGAKAGDAIDVKVSFPDDYGAEELAGKDAVFAVTVNELREAGPAAVDEDLAKNAGLENLDALRQAVRDDHEREYKALSRMRLKRTLLDKLSDAHDFDVPPGMVEREFNQIWTQVEEQRKTGEEDPDIAGKSDEELKEEFNGIAERRVRLGLVLSEVGTVNNIEVGQDDLNRAMAAEARRYPGQEQMVIDHYTKNPEAMDSLQGPVFEEKVVDFILEMATVTERKVSLEELVKEDEDEDEAKPEAEAKEKKKKAPAKKKAAAKKKPARKKAAEKDD